jgi:hypothetical protein
MLAFSTFWWVQAWIFIALFFGAMAFLILRSLKNRKRNREIEKQAARKK